MSALRGSDVVTAALDRVHVAEAIERLCAAGFRHGQIEVSPAGNDLSEDHTASQRVIINVDAGDRCDEVRDILRQLGSHVAFEWP
jgi:hypothetical protein